MVSDSNIPIIILVIALSVFFSVVAAAFFVVKKLLSGKTEKKEALFEDLARQISFTHIPDIDGNLLDKFRGFHELSRNRSYEILNLIEGMQDNGKWRIFELKQTETRPGKRALISTTIGFTMVYSVEVNGLNLPRFVLGSAGKVRETACFQGLSKLELSKFPDFNRFFFLSGKDEIALKNLFTSELVEYLIKLPDPILMEADGNMAVFYRPSMGPFSDSSELMEIPARLMFFGGIISKFRETAG